MRPTPTCSVVFIPNDGSPQPGCHSRATSMPNMFFITTGNASSQPRPRTTTPRETSLAISKPLRSTLGASLAYTNSWWEFRHDVNKGTPEGEAYFRRMVAQVKELRDAYAPEIWWFDGHWAFETQHPVDAISEVIAYILSQTPNVQINDRMGATPELEGEKNKSQDFMPPFRVYKDRAMPKQAPKVFWEHIGTVGTSWGRDKT